MVRLLDAFERAQHDPEKEGHVAVQLDRLFDSIKDSGELSDDIQLHLEELEGESLLPDIVSNVCDWYSENSFSAAREALSQLETAIAEAEEDGWLSVAAQYHYWRIDLRAGLDGHNAADEIEEALVFLEENYSIISNTFITPIVESVLENTDDLSTAVVDRWITFLEDAATSHRSANQFNRERKVLRLLRQLKLNRDHSTDDVEQTLVESYRVEADVLEEGSSLRKADTLQSGVVECGAYMTDEKQRSWKQEALQARQSGIDDELVEMSLDDLDGVDEEDLTQAMRDEADTIVEWFTQVKQDYSGAYAVYCLTLSRSLIPDVNKIRLSTEEFVVSQLFQRQIYSPEAYSISVDPSDVETIPSAYRRQAGSVMTSLGNAMYRLISEGHLTLTDIFQVFWIGDSLSPDTEAFLTDALFELSDENYVPALFLLIPHLEASIVEAFRATGRPPYTISEQGTRQQTLGGLFIDNADRLGQHYSVYLRSRYTSREGMNLRNRVAHGQVRYRNATYLDTILTLFDILKCLITINISPYLTVFGPPQTTLSPSTNYGRDTDISLFADANKQIVGYGRSSDEHTILVIREDPHEERTDLFVDSGRINRYRIGETGLTRDKIKDELDALRDDHPDIPEEITYTWLDTGDLVFHTVENIIDGELTTPADSVPKDTILAQGTTRGINESAGRIVLKRLEEQDEITTVTIQGREEILRNEEKIQVFESAQQADRIGEYRAWNIATHFDSHDSFVAADSDAFQAVEGIGPKLAEQVSNI
ncbi:DUF4209 domain-containing protein [Halosimplex pelagicum]|uniref:DUF4209 domain-containing protein n=1 Tax=Halosimplex pelagicum TaxID=869886 RepID=A0A7D5PFA0_9EURY|nr:DUF4209 domain-containing protein [Halosimplex pelagicum]QLH83000.1 DUF4209 domain-containing protein [Halosimplex pelagicum]